MDITSQGEHLTTPGLDKLISIRSAMNKGLTEKLKIAFPNSIGALRPLVDFQEIPDPNWLVGFTDGEGCFNINTFNSSASKLGEAVRLRFTLVQHSRDIELMNNLMLYLGCGKSTLSEKTNRVDFIIWKFKDIEEKLIPFFNKYPLQSSKRLEFTDFCKVALLMKNKAHLTKQGMEEIKQIKSGMNTGRN